MFEIFILLKTHEQYNPTWQMPISLTKAVSVQTLFFPTGTNGTACSPSSGNPVLSKDERAESSGLLLTNPDGGAGSLDYLH